MSAMLVCTQCGFTYDEFRTRGLLGCPECYVCFGAALKAELLLMHPGLHAVGWPGAPAPAPAASGGETGSREERARLQEMLADALRGERYEEAAALRAALRDGEAHGPG